MLLLFSHSVVFSSLPPWPVACQASLSFTISRSLLRFMSIELMMPSSHLMLCHPLLLLPSVFPSIRFCSSVSVVCIRWPNYWSFSISPSNEYLGLISFRIDWFDLLAVQGTFNSLLQHHSVKASKCFLLQSGNMLVKKFKYIQHGYPRRSLSPGSKWCMGAQGSAV